MKSSGRARQHPSGRVIDSARRSGFDRWQVLRYVIMLQCRGASCRRWPGSSSFWPGDSSLVSVIGIREFTHLRGPTPATHGGIEAFLPLAAGYLLITLPIAMVRPLMEKRFRYQM